jgi:hypothetical protein
MKKLFMAPLIGIMVCFGSAQVAKAQSPAEIVTPSQLYTTIVKLDSTLFAAFNNCNMAEFGAHFADDIEFYHDKGGLTNGLKNLIEVMEKGLCKKGNGWRSRRAVVPGSLKVYPMDKYGAILTGMHRFYETELATGKEYERSSAKFTHLFQEVNGVWKIKRVLSYDHQMPVNGK